MIYVIAAILTLVQAQTQPEAIKCVEKFLAKMAAIKGYSAVLDKKELYEEEWLEEKVGLKAEGVKSVEYTFLAKGTTGIKNNGMQLTYDGSDTLKIKWGEATGFGVLASQAAQAVTGDTLPLTGETTLKGELFTLNRAGLYHIAECMKSHLPQLKAATTGGLHVTGNCHLKYTPPALKYVQVKLKPADRVQDLEERFGTYAYMIRQANAELFPDMNALFNRTAEVEVRVPEFLMPFEMVIGAADLPEKFVIYAEGQKLGEYSFSEIRTW